MLLFHESRNDWYLVVLVLVLSVGANLPAAIAERIFINQQFLLLGLAGIVAVSLVRYLQFALLLVVVILAVGANLPTQIASEIGIDKNLLVLALGLMVAISFANKVFKLQTGLEKISGNSSLHGAVALFKAISYGRVGAVESLLKNGVNVNVRTVSGITPLILASSKGYSDVVLVLMDFGANPRIANKDNKTAIQIAENLGYTRVVEILEKHVVDTGSLAAA